MMKDPDIFIRSVRWEDRRRLNVFLPDRLIANIPINYVYSGTSYLRKLKISLKSLKTIS